MESLREGSKGLGNSRLQKAPSGPWEEEPSLANKPKEGLIGPDYSQEALLGRLGAPILGSNVLHGSWDPLPKSVG